MLFFVCKCFQFGLVQNLVMWEWVKQNGFCGLWDEYLGIMHHRDALSPLYGEHGSYTFNALPKYVI